MVEIIFNARERMVIKYPTLKPSSVFHGFIPYLTNDDVRGSQNMRFPVERE